MKIMFIDIETQNHTYFGAKASPRHPDNYVVAEGRAIDAEPFDGAITGTYFNSQAEADPAQWLSIPDDVMLLVAHNAAFEMDWFLVKQRDEILKFLARGGRVFCTAYAEYLLSNQQDTYPSLDTTAPKYGGTHKVDGVKILWEQGVLTSEIDKDLLFDQYLVGEGGDIDNTRRVFYGQLEALRERGMWDMALLRMEGLVFNCFAMDSGLHVHREVAFTQKGDLQMELNELVRGFQEHRTGIPEYIEFKETSDYHMSAWLFGGPLKYRVRDVSYEDDGVTPKYEKVSAYQFGDTFYAASDVTAENIAELESASGAAVRYKSGKNKGQLKEFKIDSDVPKLKWYDRQIELEPAVPLSMLPNDVRESFEEEFAGKRVLADGTPVYSTGSDCIEMLSKRHEFPAAVLTLLKSLARFAKVDKDLGTYYLRDKCDAEGNVVQQSGMLQYLTGRDIVHHVLNVVSTATTRLSSNRPNMQNIPRGDTSDVKRMFTSRYDNPNWLRWAVGAGVISQEVHDECMVLADAGERAGAIVEADYSALEVVTLAAFSKDENLVKALLDGIDMHCMRLAQTLGEPYESVLEKCKNEAHPQHSEYSSMRTNIKRKAFAYQYGATARGIAFSTGCTVEDAQAFIDAEKALFPQVEAWYENEVFAKVKASKTIHREQAPDGAFRPYGRGVWVGPAGTTFEFREYPKRKWENGQSFEGMEFKPTQMRNYPIQGESAFFVQGIAGQLMRWLVSKDFFGGRVCIINQVHDAVYFDCTLSVLPELARATKYIMETIPEFFKGYGYDLGVPFPAVVEAGESMFDKSKVL